MDPQQQAAWSEIDQPLAALRIWIVGDIEIARPLVSYGAQVQAVGSITDLYRELAIGPCDIVLIDTALLAGTLAETVAHLQRRDDLGIVLLANPATPQALAEGLWAGADSCLPFPPEPEVLAARLFSLRRRLPGEPAQVIQRAPAEPVAEWQLQTDGWDLLHTPSGQVLALTEAERTFLSILFAATGQTVGRAQLIAGLTDQPWNFDPHRIEVLVHRLRNRVRTATQHALPLRAIRGAGYRLTL